MIRERPGGVDRRALAAACAPQIAVAMDFAIWAVAGPRVRAALHLSAGELAWAFSGYNVAFASLLLLGGRLADATGPRRTLRAGAALFAAACAIEAGAPTAALLVWARVVQGIGAALMMPSALAIMAAAQPPGQRTMSAYGAAIAAGFATGTLLAGVIVPLAGWRASLLPGAFIASAAALVLPRERHRGAGPAVERPGSVRALAAGAGAAVVVLALGQARAHPIAAGGAAVMGGAVLAVTARRTAAHATVLAGGAGALVLTATGTAGVLLVSVRLQDGLGWSATAAGAALAAFGVMTWPASLAHRALTSRLPPAAGVAAGLLFEGAALGLLASAYGSVAVLTTAVAVLGFTHVVGNAAVAASAMAGTQSRRGERAAVVSAAGYLGGAVGPLSLTVVPAATAGGYLAGMGGASAVAVAGCLLVLAAGRSG